MSKFPAKTHCNRAAKIEALHDIVTLPFVVAVVGIIVLIINEVGAEDISPGHLDLAALPERFADLKIEQMAVAFVNIAITFRTNLRHAVADYIVYDGGTKPPVGVAVRNAPVDDVG